MVAVPSRGARALAINSEVPGRGLQGGRARGAQAVQLSQLQLLVPDCMPRTQATMMALTRMLLLLLSGSPGQLWCCAAAKPSIIHIVADGERSSERSRDALCQWQCQ